MASKRKSKKSGSEGPERQGGQPMPMDALPKGARKAAEVARRAFRPLTLDGLEDSVTDCARESPSEAEFLADRLGDLGRLLHELASDHGRRESPPQNDRRNLQETTEVLAERARLLQDGALKTEVQGIVSDARAFANALRAPENVSPQAGWSVLPAATASGRCNRIVELLRKEAHVQRKLSVGDLATAARAFVGSSVEDARELIALIDPLLGCNIPQTKAGRLHRWTLGRAWSTGAVGIEREVERLVGYAKRVEDLHFNATRLGSRDPEEANRLGRESVVFWTRVRESGERVIGAVRLAMSLPSSGGGPHEKRTDRPKLDPTDERILRLLLPVGIRLRTEAIAHKLLLKPGSIGANLSRLKNELLYLDNVRRNKVNQGRGVGYDLTPEGRAVAERLDPTAK